MKTETVTIIEEQELNELITKEFGKKFDFSRDQEKGDGSFCEFYLRKEGCLGHEADRVNAWVAGKDSGWLAGALMQSLCFKGKLPPGKILVECADYT